MWSGIYDASGDLTCRAPTHATTCSGTPTGAVLGYDNQGQLATWQNVPSSPTATDRFLYDGEGARVEQVATSGETTTTTAYYGGLALSVNGTLSYTLSDGLGSVSASVNTSGTVTASQLYGPYGSVRYQSGTLPTSKGYTGQRADGATGLDYYGARYYDPVAGQFASADTSMAGGLNRYAYVSGRPESATDPSGHQIMEADPERTNWAGKRPHLKKVILNREKNHRVAAHHSSVESEA